MNLKRKIAVVGLGYVGLPVAVAFARAGFDTIGFDISATRVAELKRGHDATREVSIADLRASGLQVTSDLDDIRAFNFFIVAVPTPITKARSPDLMPLMSATRSVGAVLNRDDIVVYESTVYPGATEEECLPLLEQLSGLKAPADFQVGYSPERINPGDHEHRFDSIVKVVSAQTPEALEIVADAYGAVVSAGVHKAPSIRVAEAAKVIENTQRDLNIALMNELSLIFSEIGLDTGDVLAAARTKWNFLPFSPGLVGGHCIGVDPYYLTHKAQSIGLHPEVILAGRRANDMVGQRVAMECLRLASVRGARPPSVAVLGVTFKENVPDIRNSKVADVVRALKRFEARVEVFDSEAAPEDVLRELGISLKPLEAAETFDVVILAVPHSAYLERGWPLIKSMLREGGAVMDLKGALQRSDIPDDVRIWRL